MGAGFFCGAPCGTQFRVFISEQGPQLIDHKKGEHIFLNGGFPRRKHGIILHPERMRITLLSLLQVLPLVQNIHFSWVMVAQKMQNVPHPCPIPQCHSASFILAIHHHLDFCHNKADCNMLDSFEL